jgi:hypothetical protein
MFLLPENFISVKKAIASGRNCGTCHLQVLPDMHSFRGAIAAEFGKLPDNTHYFPSGLEYEITESEARSVIYSLLRWDMAYGAEAMREEEAARLSNAFLQLFPAPARYRTNGIFLPHSRVRDNSGKLAPVQLSEWHSLSDATFDSGVAVFTEYLTGFLWFTDED